MKRAWIASAIALLALIAADSPKPDPGAGKSNLIPNGDFETGDLTPEGWQSVDGLSSFYVTDDDPKHGKVVKFDSDVLQSQAYEWWTKIADGASPKDAPQKLPTVEPKYDTLAGLDGVWYWSDFIPVEPGKAYWLTIDVKGPGILTWLVGYPEKGSTAFGAEAGAFLEYRRNKKLPMPEFKGRNHTPTLHNYVWKGQLAAGGSDGWKTYSRREKPFRPTAATPKVRFVRVLVFPFWPPATTSIDNVRLTEVPE